MTRKIETETQPQAPKTYSTGDVEMWPNVSPPPTYLVDGVRGVNIANGIVRISFVEAVIDPTGEEILGRQNVAIAMPLSVFKNTVKNLQHVIEENEKD